MGDHGALTSQQRTVMAATITASALLFSSLTSITVALPVIQRDLGISSSALHWVIVAALLPLCALAVVSGRLGDVLGRRRVFLAGIIAFGAGSVLCAVAPDEVVLVAARGIQGIGVALAVPLALANLTGALPGHRRGWAIGVLSAVTTGVSVAVPPSVAVLVHYVSWRWLFVAFVPVTVYVFLAGRRHIAESPRPPGASMDVRGCLFIAGGLTLLVFAFERSSDWGFTDRQTLVPLAAGLLLLLAFVRNERRAADPLLDLRPLGRSGVSVPLTALAFAQCAVLVVTVYVTLYLQQVLDLGTVETGLLMLPASVGSVLLGPVVGRLTDRGAGHHLVLGGLVLLTASVLWLALGVTHRHGTLLVPALLLLGLAVPLIYPSAGALSLGALPPSARGVAASLQVEARQIGATMGLALMSALFTYVEWQERNARLADPGEHFTADAQNGLDTVLTDADKGRALLDRLPPAERRLVHDAADAAFTTALTTTLLTAAAVLFLGVLLALGAFHVPRRTNRGPGTQGRAPGDG
ncbi:MFS transporter [Streptomyces sp. NPDC047108]|uniref:MFS transporter n=1 Tax=Streptomyces sp. NPDC047108 TaxID=3155025 RepID=UPI00340FF48D